MSKTESCPGTNDEKPWIWSIDPSLLDKHKLWLEPNYRETDLDDVDIRFPKDVIPDTSRTLSYVLKGGQPERLMKYDLYPSIGGSLIVNSRLRDALEGLCGTDQVLFYKADIRTKKGNQAEGWCVAPVHRVRAIDMENSVVSEWYGDRRHPAAFASIAFHKGCLGKLHIARDGYKSGLILISDRLKIALEGFNTYGMKFERDVDWRPAL